MATAPRRPSGPSPTPSQSSYGTPTALARNPLHLKVNRILSANFEDSGTRTALDTLGEFQLESDTVQLASKGKLRKHVEARMASGSNQFLQAFGEVNQVTIQSIFAFSQSRFTPYADRNSLCCNRISTLCTNPATKSSSNSPPRTTALATSSNTLKDYESKGMHIAHPLHFHSSQRCNDRATTSSRQSLVHLFLTRFTLSESEVKALTSREVPVGPALFAAMDKTERIRADCRALLSGEAGQGTQAGCALAFPFSCRTDESDRLDIMEYTASHLDAGYTKIFKWCSFECRGFSKDALEVSAIMRSAISRLRARPDLLEYVPSLLLHTVLMVRNVTVKSSPSSAKRAPPPSSISSSKPSPEAVPPVYPVRSNCTLMIRYVTSVICSLGSIKPSPANENSWRAFSE